MLHEFQDMDPDYTSQLFLQCKQLLPTIESHTILPANGLCARSVLTTAQLDKVLSIRKRKLHKVLDRFILD
jgi:hypothetical protein